jgi:hypothetical protein
MGNELDHQRFRRNRWKVAVACSIGVAASLHALYRELDSSAPSGEGPQVATLVRKTSIARRRSSGTYEWRSIPAEGSLHRKDALQTGIESSAVIRMNDGSELELGESSLIVLDELTQSSLDFLRGSVVIHAKGQARRLTAGRDGMRTEEKLKILLRSPASSDVVYVGTTSAAVPVEFAWTSQVLEPGPLVLEVSSRPGFPPGEETIVNPIAGDSGERKTLSLAPGPYHWRIRSPEGELLSQSRRFSVRSPSPLLPISPTSGETVHVFDGAPRTKFSWQLARRHGARALADTDSATHVLQVSADESFARIAQAREVSAASGSSILSGLGPGRWYWRLLSDYPGTRVSSETQAFSLERTGRLELALLEPGPEARVPEDRKSRFRWRIAASTEVPAEYRVEFRSASGAAAAGAFDSRSTFLDWSAPSPGRFEWRVIALVNGREAGASPWQAFEAAEGKGIELLEPAAGATSFFWSAPPSIDFRWRPAASLQPGAGQARLQIALDRGFSKLVFEGQPRSRNAETLALESRGEHFWRVQHLDEAGHPIRSSEARAFVYDVHPPLGAPVPETPAEIALADYPPESPARLRWMADPDAREYEVTISPSSGERSPASLTASGSLPIGDLPEGDYAWSVRSIDRLGRKGAASPTTPLRVRYGKLLPPPRIVSPEAQ